MRSILPHRNECESGGLNRSGMQAESARMLLIILAGEQALQMIRGVVDGRRQAWVSVEALKGDGGVQSVAAVIDTGFNEYLTLPIELIEQLGLCRTILSLCD